MRITPEGVALVKHFEGLRLKAYPDPGTGGEPWTIGYGHTGGVKPGDEITTEMAELMLLRDLRKFEDGVTSAVRVAITPSQFSACVSFSYNVGLGNFGSSTLLKMINAGNADAAADQFLRWNRAAGKVLPGLTARREAERRLYKGLPWLI